MAWTEELIVEEFRKHITYWQEKLRLRDTEILIRIVDEIDGHRKAWCAVARYNCGANPYAVDFQILRDLWHHENKYDVWSTVAHELVHVMNWSMSYAVSPLEDHFSVSQMNMVNSLLKRGNEELAYKWESILTAWFASDAPPKEIP